MALNRLFPIAGGKKIRILVLGKRELPEGFLETDSQKKEIRKRTDLPASDVYILGQVHGDRVLDFDKSDPNQSPEGDAWFGLGSNRILCIKTADCMPLFFWSETSDRFAAVHSGWKGTLAGISEKTLSTTFPSETLRDGSLRGFLGPCAREFRYEVGEDVASLFRAEDPDCLSPTGNGKFLLNLEKFLRFRLEKRGIKIVLESCGIDTLEEGSDFFSHRKKENGRNLNLIWKED
ncbi:laccase domain-containing protein [Leptospira gomenensis]|uniref:Laccase domain-containing protein n=1 Tax=Leptospira gomenensis TaxID=2484974 RepID=A0A5F1YD57_9LEPT|nr:polyphenol oxidase family protein [Leptospira gomenensis]TGK35176.1 laccase domain-containing protein [Leptospira gomenensis]TGK35883.1 laccase domain-containing protein [Leptospira gomenensis]TGK41038.1 laccase domain-containing protein [Leptospira gomenensis]TGK61267.1 laccase domain-containing protein [Leptospira gomenensis]